MESSGDQWWWWSHSNLNVLNSLSGSLENGEREIAIMNVLARVEVDSMQWPALAWKLRGWSLRLSRRGAWTLVAESAVDQLGQCLSVPAVLAPLAQR